MRVFFALIILFILSFGGYAQDYSCEKLKKEDKTQKWYFAIIEFKEDKSFRIVKGIAEIAGKPTENVFVEVFADKNPNRIEGCKTGTNGKFGFPNLKKGNYTIRLSKDGYQLTQIRIKVSPKSKNRKDITGILEVGH